MINWLKMKWHDHWAEYHYRKYFQFRSGQGYTTAPKYHREMWLYHLDEACRYEKLKIN